MKNELLHFWFSPPMSEHWFSANSAIDKEIKSRFEALWQSAKQGQQDHWKDTAKGCLALCIVLDQLPLNMFRGTAKSFSSEAQAIQVTKYAIKLGLDDQLAKDQVSFLYMPLMHSESLADQQLSVQLFEKAGLENNVRFAKHHCELIAKFGRFPHRNQILQRISTAEEMEYLQSKQAFKG